MNKLEVIPPDPPQPKYRIILEVTQGEAMQLLTMCQRIGGSPENSARGIFEGRPDSIKNLLGKEGLTYNPGVNYGHGFQLPDLK